MKLTVLAPAKINLSLDIVGRRPDGYHDVSMVMQTVSLYDTVTVSDELEEDCKENIMITCDVAGIPTDSSNIAYKAASEFFRYCRLPEKKISIDIQKKIPSQAGLAGGSTDAAAVIIALNFMCNQKLTQEQMCEIGERVGADVPFCIVGGTKLATGTGTTLEDVANITKCAFVICKPDVSVSTAKAYALADSKEPKGFIVTDEVVKMLYRRNLRGVSQCLYNEFEAVMDLPEIIDIKKQILKNKALGACMSGSGSAVFGIFLNKKKAEACKEKMSDSFDKLYVCEPVKHGCKIV